MFAYAVQVAVLEIRETRSKYEELQSQNADLAVQLANAESKCRELAAESYGMKQLASEAYDEMVSHHDTDSLYSLDADGEQMDALIRLCDAQATIYDTLVMCETPATDAFLAEVRASARNEGINYAASRLAAAFNHGFLDKPVAEVLDVTRMILSAKEDLANDSLPAADGLSGEYAEKAIEEWAAKLSEGGEA
ncbi:hypothetical protein BED42_22615 [Citrobacter portucalensis]|nr:hypothetical protein [Citrobacter portucalensis]OIY05197.1 hypothetical protein BED42_22615 [Citrobacter portucalensis]